MGEYFLKWSVLAIIDRDSLYKWVYDRNRSAAKRIDGKVMASISLLKDAPKMGAGYDIKGVRKHPVSGTEFTVFYTIVSHDIVILRLLHQSQDVPTIHFTNDGGGWLM